MVFPFSFQKAKASTSNYPINIEPAELENNGWTMQEQDGTYLLMISTTTPITFSNKDINTPAPVLFATAESSKDEPANLILAGVNFDTTIEAGTGALINGSLNMYLKRGTTNNFTL